MPLVILQNNRIFRLNDTAKDCGIAPGVTLATAHSIYPDLTHKQRDETLEQQRLSSLANTLYRFSSHVSIQPPDCILLEIGASLKLFGCHTELTQQAMALCESLGHRCVGRVAQTPWASIALARSAQQRLADVPLSDAGLEMAGINTNTVERFANMGIYTLGPLLKLPDKALGRRFGKPLLRYLQQLTGALPDPRKTITLAPGFRRTLHLLQPLSDKNDLYGHPASPVPQLLRELEQWLVSRQLGCEQLSWHLHSHNREVAHLPIRFASLKQTAGDFLHISKLKLEQYELPAEVLSVSLQAQLLQAWRGTSRGLFGMYGSTELSSQSVDTHADDRQIMSELIDEFTARLGKGTCHGLHSIALHAPERAWQALQAHDCVGQLPVRPYTLGIFSAPCGSTPTVAVRAAQAGTSMTSNCCKGRSAFRANGGVPRRSVAITTLPDTASGRSAGPLSTYKTGGICMGTSAEDSFVKSAGVEIEFAELHCLSNYSFLRGASHPEELVAQAHALGYRALAITDECSYAGLVKAHIAAKAWGIKLIIGAEFAFALDDQQHAKVVLLATNRATYGQLAALITKLRRRSEKAVMPRYLTTSRWGLSGCLALWVPPLSEITDVMTMGQALQKVFPSYGLPWNCFATGTISTKWLMR